MPRFFPYLALMLLLGCSGQPFASMAGHRGAIDRPNILFLLADDWSYPHAGAYGDPVVRTPVFDRLAREGALFTQAFCAAPSCSPSRAAILTGRYPHELGPAGNLWSTFPSQLTTYTQLLKKAGYEVGSHRKGWGPGDFESDGYQHNPAGESWTDFASFLEERPANRPFCFWIGSTDPHRPYDVNAGAKAGMDPEAVRLPEFYPDLDCIRNDFLDYYYEVERFDRQAGQAIDLLEKEGVLANTLIVMTADNGMPFPRAKANLYDLGTRVPLVIYWQGKVLAGRQLTELTNLIDLAPTFLEAAGLAIPADLSGTSLLPLLTTDTLTADSSRSQVFLERERHAYARTGNASYPMRAVRTDEWLYIRNFEPDRWPAGEPDPKGTISQYGDVDNSITKYLILQRENEFSGAIPFRLCFGKRPAEELYYLPDDPDQWNNVADSRSSQAIKQQLSNTLNEWMLTTNDLRATSPQTTYWDSVRYVPVYQHKTKLVEREIDNYWMMRPDGFGRFTEAGCH